MKPAQLGSVLVAAAAAVGAWLLLGGGGDGEPETAPGSIVREGWEEPESAPGVRLEGTEPVRPETPRRRRYPPQVPMSQVPRGEIRARLVDTEGVPVPSQDVRVVVEETERAFWPPPTGMTDAETGGVRFLKVPAGRARLRASGDHVLDAVETVDVAADLVTDATITLRRAGAVSYVAALYNGEVPERVTVSLHDEKGKPVPAWWQVRTTTVLTEPRRGTEVTQGAAGIAYGVPPGTYRLRGRSPGEDVDEQEVRIEAGRTAEVRLSFRE